MRDLLEAPPPAIIEFVTDVLHGVPITDPYRWLEDQHSPRTREWLIGQAAYARSYLGTIPGRVQVRKRIMELLTINAFDSPRKVANRVFFMKREASDQQPVIAMREGLDGEDIVLVNPTSIEGTSTSIGILSVSRNGKFLAFSVRQGGEDFQSIRILDVDQREVLADRFPRGISRGLVFSEDLNGFFYSHDEVVKSGRSHHAAYWHKLGTKVANDTEAFATESSPNLQLCVFGSPTSHYVGYLVRRDGDLRAQEFYVQDMRHRTPPRQIGETFVGVFIPIFMGGIALCLTTNGAPNGQVMVFDLDRPNCHHWRTLVRESGAKIEEVVVAGGMLFVRYVENAESHVRLFDLSGGEKGILPCPRHGTPRFFPCDPESDVLFYRFSSFTQPPKIHCYEPRTKKERVWATKQVPMETSSSQVKRQEYISRDGTHVPITLIFPKGSSPRNLPTLLTGYGGFGSSQTPQFTTFGSFLVEKGCIYAVANIRGGAEFGDAWHQTGKRRNKQNAIDDFIAAAEWLLCEGYTAPGHLAIAGGSNAGLLVAAAMTQRPDLFRAVLCIGPLLDMLRYQLFDQASKWASEYGCADNAEDFESILAYSPYHRVKDNTAYPAVMFISGDSDTRCNPMHTRKMVARLQASSTSSRPIILDYRPNWGHMPVQPLNTRIEVLADRLSFLCKELGVEI